MGCLVVKLLAEVNTELLAHRLEVLDVLLVLLGVLDLVLQALKDAHGRRVVVHTTRSLERLLDNLGRWDEVLRECIVKAALELKEVLHAVKELDVARVELLESLTVARVVAD